MRRLQPSLGVNGKTGMKVMAGWGQSWGAGQVSLRRRDEFVGWWVTRWVTGEASSGVKNNIGPFRIRGKGGIKVKAPVSQTLWKNSLGSLEGISQRQC